MTIQYNNKSDQKTNIVNTNKNIINTNIKTNTNTYKHTITHIHTNAKQTQT
jgi:hypothetical protein